MYENSNIIETSDSEVKLVSSVYFLPLFLRL